LNVITGTINLWASKDVQSMAHTWTGIETGDVGVPATSISPETVDLQGVECWYWEIPFTVKNQKQVKHLIGVPGWVLELKPLTTSVDAAKELFDGKNAKMPKPEAKAPEAKADAPEEYSESEKKELQAIRKQLLKKENKKYSDLPKEEKAEMDEQSKSILKVRQAERKSEG